MWLLRSCPAQCRASSTQRRAPSGRRHPNAGLSVQRKAVSSFFFTPGAQEETNSSRSKLVTSAHNSRPHPPVTRRTGRPTPRRGSKARVHPRLGHHSAPATTKLAPDRHCTQTSIPTGRATQAAASWRALDLNNWRRNLPTLFPHLPPTSHAETTRRAQPCSPTSSGCRRCFRRRGADTGGISSVDVAPFPVREGTVDHLRPLRVHKVQIPKECVD